MSNAILQAGYTWDNAWDLIRDNYKERSYPKVFAVLVDGSYPRTRNDITILAISIIFITIGFSIGATQIPELADSASQTSLWSVCAGIDLILVIGIIKRVHDYSKAKALMKTDNEQGVPLLKQFMTVVVEAQKT